MTGKGLLYTSHPYIIPNSPASTVSFEEEIHGEACPCLTPSSETEEDDLLSAVKEGRQKRLRGPPKHAWTNPFLEKQAADKPLKRSHSVNTISLEAAGRHIPLQNHPLGNSKGDSGRYHIVVSNFSCLNLSLSGFNFNLTKPLVIESTGSHILEAW